MRRKGQKRGDWSGRRPWGAAEEPRRSEAIITLSGVDACRHRDASVPPASRKRKAMEGNWEARKQS